MHILNQMQVNLTYITRTATYSYGSKFSFLQQTFTIQLPTDSRATCQIGINNAPAFHAGRSFSFGYQGNGASPCQYIDTTQKAIDYAIISPLTVVK